ncbi:methyltransferase domain-containing protein [Ferrimonas balearica]|uniref:methyltransferase domain-containing protein n=1 Tax=Ferrimonas balearica TaxID=44012 RepID=UPI001C999D97|nr:methyltransferase domain-containing protein [Ferrimonas balearica]MBY5991299.1 methyltransferase domain-containing protein [Ferrimonas balearica]
MNDTNFDSRAHKFASNIYGTSKGRVREAVLWHQVSQRLLTRLPAAAPILDAGGGQGQLARRIAAAGHPVVLNDLSAEMLAMARSRAEAEGLEKRFDFEQGPIQSLPDALGWAFEGILCHAVLEWSEDPKGILAALAQLLAPGGRLSLAFFNHQGAELHNLVAGNFDNLGEAMTSKQTRRVRMVPHNPLKNDEVIAQLSALGLEVEHQCGVRVIHDYLRDKSLQQSQLERLIELELEYCDRPLYREMGRYTHLLVRKPAA